LRYAAIQCVVEVVQVQDIASAAGMYQKNYYFCKQLAGVQTSYLLILLNPFIYKA
jgi:hypothetical protein